MMKSRKVTWAGHLVRMEDVIIEYEISFGKARRKKLLGRHKCVQKCDTKMYLQENEIKWKDMDWIYLAQVGDLW